jgi:RND family efflux transporter MFP subunit
MSNHLVFFAFGFIALCSACGAPAPAPDTEENLTTGVQAPPAVVSVTPARQDAFALRIFSSGVLRAQQKNPISMRIGGIVEALPIQPGQYVRQGTLLARLDEEALQLQLLQRKTALDEAIIEKQDLLILQRGRPDDDQSVPPEKLATILTRSGYNRALLGMQQAEQELRQCRVYAPFDGIVADLKVKPGQQVNAGQEICTLINPATFEAEFNLLEREAFQISVGQVVRVRATALSEAEFTGTISTINPVVSEQGLVTVRARVNVSAGSRLFEGMNVQVIIEKKVPKQLVLPKSAVVLRSARPVVFTFSEKEGLAKWNYVTIAYENDQEVAISEGIKFGDQVIYEGNLNLDHDAAVKIKTTQN